MIEAKGPGFPVRSYVLELPTNRALTANDVQVTENGSSVVEETLVPASQATRRTFGVVLVLDASDSMAGKPITEAVAAEHAFVAQRNANQQLGLVAFNSEASVVLPLTTSSAKIAAALASPPRVGYGTHIFDAIAKAEAMLEQAKISAGSIVLLSDGADTGSTHTAAEVAAKARAAHFRIFTIGLQSRSFKPHTLESLAAVGGGQYAQAKTTSDLNPLFDQLGQLLSRDYLLQYKSLAGPHVKVNVAVQVAGAGSASATYTTPTLPAKSIPAPYSPSVGSRIWTSPITMVLFGLVVALVVALLVFALLQPRRSGLPARMAQFVTVPGLRQERRTAGARVEPAAKQGQKDFWTRFQEQLEIAEIHARPQTIVFGTVVATILAFLLISAVGGSPWWGLFALVVPFVSREWVLRTLARRRDRFAEQLPDALNVISSALRSGHSFAGALAVVVEGASEPMRGEMQRVVADEQRGVRVEESLLAVAERMNSRDLEQLALVAELQRESGGSSAEVVDRVAETVRERFEVRRLVKTLTVQGRMSRWIVSAIPVVIILFLQLINPHYLHPLLESVAGQVVFGIAAALVVVGSLVIKKIVEIEI